MRKAAFVAALGFAFMYPAFSQDKPATAELTSIEAFDQKSDEGRAETIRAALKRLYNYYAARDTALSACMVDLFRPASSTSETVSDGYLALAREIDADRRDSPAQRRTIERIIFDIVSIKCDG